MWWLVAGGCAIGKLRLPLPPFVGIRHASDETGRQDGYIRENRGCGVGQGWLASASRPRGVESVDTEGSAGVLNMPNKANPSGRDCRPRLREGRLASLGTMTHVRRDAGLPNKANFPARPPAAERRGMQTNPIFRVFGLTMRVARKTKPIPRGRAGPPPREGHVRQTKPICRGRLAASLRFSQCQGCVRPVAPNKANCERAQWTLNAF